MKTAVTSALALAVLVSPLTAQPQNDFIKEGQRRLGLWRDCLYASFVSHASAAVELNLSAEFAFQACVTEETATKNWMIGGGTDARMIHQTFSELRLKFKTDMISGWNAVQRRLQQN